MAIGTIQTSIENIKRGLFEVRAARKQLESMPKYDAVKTVLSPVYAPAVREALPEKKSVATKYATEKTLEEQKAIIEDIFIKAPQEIREEQQILTLAKRGASYTGAIQESDAQPYTSDVWTEEKAQDLINYWETKFAEERQEEYKEYKDITKETQLIYEKEKETYYQGGGGVDLSGLTDLFGDLGGGILDFVKSPVVILIIIVLIIFMLNKR